MKNSHGCVVPRLSLIVLAVATALLSAPARAEAPPASKPAAAAAKPAAAPMKKLDVDQLKQQYWKGNAPELGVVQNRIYTKSGKLNLMGMYGSLSSNPFLNTSTIGGLVGFSFSEYLGINLLYLKASNSKSSAYDAFVAAANFGANTNEIATMMGGELSYSLLYGKLSLIGKAILHFDFFLHAGASQVSAANGTAIAPMFGFGQQIYITTWASLRADFRYMMFTENVVEMFRPETLGTVIATRSVQASLLNVGIAFLLF